MRKHSGPIEDCEICKSRIFCPLCGDSIRSDPNPRVNRVRAWSWRLAHRLNCQGAAS